MDFDQPQYVSWRSSSESSLLWLHGHPGTGKSTLIFYRSLLIDSMRVNAFHTQMGALAYVYCSRNTSDRQSGDPETLGWCILKHLSRPGPGIPIRGIIKQKYREVLDEGDDGAGPGWVVLKLFF
ncbi:hypothetical protein BO71DRAFT_118918 [Aspergillus ellipticus CBS 707.79]|uniref:Nephrocystin 3-like N-terminal domain-containing protein n=1 Tax=Aspergillus ellipticus CBS 707.79 TaxID=1448320 RepID=A0A319CWX1_9EURO|nr:hypothetical protein BO71DRAFT_118918 [Aspergillus ellipticus CBS 707.79]